MGVYVPLVRQAYDYSCGAASLASILYYWGVWEGREPQLYRIIKTTRKWGTPGYGLVKGIKEFGLKHRMRVNLTVKDLKRFVRLGRTVILSIQAWGDWNKGKDLNEVWEDGHYVVLVDIDLKKGQIVMMDPGVAGYYRTMDIVDFEKIWHDYGDNSEKQYHACVVVWGKKKAWGIGKMLRGKRDS